MRISDDRYSRERSCLDLALRFLRHEARTQTIRAWTGLTDDRIRNLYRSYMRHGARFVPRHRGKSPHQVDLLHALAAHAVGSRAAREPAEPAQRASWSCWCRTPSRHFRYHARSATLLCVRALSETVPTAQISFEHAVFLTTALTRGDQLRLGGCSECGALIVMERFPMRDK